MNKTFGQLWIERLNMCVFEFDEVSNTTKIYHPEWMHTLPDSKEVHSLLLCVGNVAGFINYVGLEAKLDHVCCTGNFDSVEKLQAFNERKVQILKKLYPNYF